MLQRLPEDAEDAVASDHVDDWRRAMILMQTCTEAELTDPSLESERLLYRLFHEDGVRVFAPTALRRGCRCSRERVARILRSLSRTDVNDYKVDGVVSMTCEFCNRSYDFDDAALEQVFAGA